MSVTEVMHIGYLKTNCWSKVQHLFGNQVVTKLALKRSRSEKDIRERPHPWLQVYIYATGHLAMDWDFWKHKVPYKLARKELDSLIEQNLFRDCVVEKIEIGLNHDEDLVEMINNRLKDKGIKYPLDTQFYVTYKNSPLAYSQPNSINVKPIRQINEIAITELGFKLAVLDLKEIHSYSKGEKDISKLLDDRDIILRIIREHIDHDRWFQLPEVKQVHGKTYPGSIRTYERRRSDTWSLVNDEEIR